MKNLSIMFLVAPIDESQRRVGGISYLYAFHLSGDNQINFLGGYRHIVDNHEQVLCRCGTVAVELSWPSRESDGVLDVSTLDDVGLRTTTDEGEEIARTKPQELAGSGAKGNATVDVDGESTLLLAWTVEDDDIIRFHRR